MPINVWKSRATDSSSDAMTVGAGRPPAISRAMLGPERTAIGTPGIAAPRISLMRLPLSASIPFVADTIACRSPTSALRRTASSRTPWLGTATTIRAHLAASSKDAVSVTLSGIGTPGR